MRRGHQRVCRDVVGGLDEGAGNKKHEGAKHDQVDAQPEQVLDGEVGVEGDVVLVGEADAGRVAALHGVQGDQVDADHGEDQEREQVVQGEEARQRGIPHREVAAQPQHDLVADERRDAEQVGDDLRAPVGHLSPRQQVAHERGRHNHQHQPLPRPPHQFARLVVGGVIQRARHVHVDHHEESGRAGGVDVAQQPAVVHVAHDVLHRIERHVHVRFVVHGEEDAGGELQHQHEAGEKAEIPPVAQVARRGVIGQFVFDDVGQGETLVDPV